VDGIYCEVMLGGRLIFMKNDDVPGVIGQVGTVLGESEVNIANFSLGRADKPDPQGAVAVAVVEVDSDVSEDVISKLKALKAVRVARVVTF
jgi:D-3-phosphoglycerate dehydrogenase / 2-oxoglutarate reductase